jgi:hypothetical protein
MVRLYQALLQADTSRHAAHLAPMRTASSQHDSIIRSALHCKGLSGVSLITKTLVFAAVLVLCISTAQVFDGESLLVAPQQPASSLSVPLTPRRDTPVLLLMKVLVGSRTSSIYHVFELDLGMLSMFEFNQQ